MTRLALTTHSPRVHHAKYFIPLPPLLVLVLPSACSKLVVSYFLELTFGSARRVRVFEVEREEPSEAADLALDSLRVSDGGDPPPLAAPRLSLEAAAACVLSTYTSVSSTISSCKISSRKSSIVAMPTPSAVESSPARASLTISMCTRCNWHSSSASFSGISRLTRCTRCRAWNESSTVARGIWRSKPMPMRSLQKSSASICRGLPGACTGMRVCPLARMETSVGWSSLVSEGML
mmetsp:Transcript_12290/g.31434  ORF Transcript_12290/g.31434 Transcript_12290/m.31434 type:complete len:235 (+) Transcript_12290:167-871(+)